jgi:hypothetical protein
MEREFVESSGIAPPLYQATTRLVADMEVLPGGDVIYPIHDALNWRVIRFGKQARSDLQAVLLLNEDGSCWQAKLSQPKIDSKKQKPRKYEAPVGNGSRVYLPPVPTEIRQRVGARYGVEIPLTGSFWNWVEQHPEIPMVPTEGGKKGLALLSQGYVPLVLYGVNSGYRKHLDDSRELIPDVTRFAHGGRTVTLAFDQDTSDTAKRRVRVALFRFGRLLKQAGCSVQIATWHPEQGKGVDDLIANSGASGWDTAYSQALSWEHWQIQQHLERRLTFPGNLRVDTADLATLTLDQIPATGIIAVASSKGSGKTKLIASLVHNTERVLAGGHRIALMRNLSTRLGLDYKGDLDKVNGTFINGAAYTFRVGLCVDSLLAIDPSQFVGCDLILDEVVQVVRHLLTSSTCARDGKRPALLARFRELVRVARRVIVADADLDNATLLYLKQLREEDGEVFLIHNAYQAVGYPVRFIQAPNRTAIVQTLLNQVAELEPGKVIFVATDSKGTSKALSRLLQQGHPEKRVLLVNSETSGGDCEREFIQTPNPVLESDEYDIIICSPSVATGVSIELQGKVAAVYGIFTGASSTDADMAQALGRVREPVPRVVWCANRGSNFSKVSRSTNAQELKEHLYQKASTTIQLIRSSLREDMPGVWKHYDWQQDPHLDLYCRMAAAQNFSMHHLRDALLVRLRFEGNPVTIENRETDPAMRSLLATARQEQLELDAESLVAAEDLTYAEVLALEQKEGVTPEEAKAVAKFYLRDFYCFDTLSVEDVLWDNEGRRRGELLNLEAQLFPGVASDRSAKALEKQANWNQGYCPWDLSHEELRRRLRNKIGLDELIAKLRAGWKWTKYDLAPYAKQARALKAQVRVALHFTITDGMSDVQIIHQLLSQMGIRVAKPLWSRQVPGFEGKKLRVYSLHQEHWQKVWHILQQRQQRRQQIQQHRASEFQPLDGSPVRFNFSNEAGDPAVGHLKDLSQWMTAEALEDVRSWLQIAQGDLGLINQIRQVVPAFVLEKLLPPLG